jgi:hypothetical protein
MQKSTNSASRQIDGAATTCYQQRDQVSVRHFVFQIDNRLSMFVSSFNAQPKAPAYLLPNEAKPAPSAGR